MWRQQRGGILAVLVAVLVIGCSPAMGTSGSAGGSASSSSVEVENNKWMDVVVYAVRNGRKQRLGMVTSSSTERFRLPGWALNGAGDLALLIDPIGTDNVYYTGPIPLTPGDAVTLRVENHMALSSFFVRSR